LGETLGMSRAAINKHIQTLRDWGVDVFTVPGKGYSLPEPIQLLNAKQILGQLDGGSVAVLPVIDSTNQYLLDRIGELKSGDACIAEYQQAGRGRRGRKWFSPFGANLYLSMFWRLEQGPAAAIGLSRWPEHRRVELITTDGFLHPNQVLKERGLMKKKGFPESYDMHRLVKFVSDLKSGVPNVTAPVYSHLIYDVIPDGDKTVVQPDILILEGLNVLQSGMDYPHDPHHVFVSDFVDFSIYVDAPEDLLQTWYINRFLKFREGAFTDPDSYFHNYAKLTKEEAIKTAMTLWKEINWLNLKQNILPTRERASLILTKSANHAVEEVRLRK
jgi:biotin operon repressor BirA-like protein